MKNLIKKMLCLILVGTLTLGTSTAVLANEKEELASIDPYTIEGEYVQKLVDINEDSLSKLSLKEASELFEEAFEVPASSFSEEEIRLALDGLSFGLKFQNDMQMIKLNEEYEPSYSPNVRSTTGNKSYSGNVGVAWVRDTTSGHSPLTLGEILSGSYTLEVDYITLDTAASILASSASYDSYSDFVQALAVNATATALTNKIIRVLGLASGWKATVASIAVSTAVGCGWNWLQKIDRSRMYDCFSTMDGSAAKRDMMKVQFMWASNMVNKFYTKMSKTTVLPNPFPGTYGDWYTNKYGYLYGY